jgi:uncharacterized metal-binding protein YceD (DUF177 family)
MMLLELNTLPAGSSEEIFESLAPLLNDEGIDWEPLALQVDLSIDNQAPNYYLHGKLKCTGRFQCDLGLELFEDTLTGEFDLVVSYDHSRFEGAEGEDIILLSQGEHTVDLSSVVRDTIMLAIPISHICGPDCSSAEKLRKSIVIEPETDERWDKLKDLFKEEEK